MKRAIKSLYISNEERRRPGIQDDLLRHPPLYAYATQTVRGAFYDHHPHCSGDHVACCAVSEPDYVGERSDELCSVHSQNRHMLIGDHTRCGSSKWHQRSNGRAMTQLTRIRVQIKRMTAVSRVGDNVIPVDDEWSNQAGTYVIIYQIQFKMRTNLSICHIKSYYWLIIL